MLHAAAEPSAPPVTQASASTDLRADDVLLDVMRDCVFDLIAPVCILDTGGRIVDWNPSFDELVARALHLVPGQPALDQLGPPDSLASPDSQSQTAVTTTSHKLVLPDFGEVHCRRITAPISNHAGEVVGWCVQFNLTDAREIDRVWDAIRKHLQQQLIWSRYGAVYDSLLTHFGAYRHLQRLVAGQAGPARICVDLGAGTGSTSLALLAADPAREVYAVDINEIMLRQLRAKAREQATGRLHILKSDIRRMPGFRDGMFDAATLVNTLYAVDDPSACLRETRRIVRPGGVVVLSNPHRETRVDRLFEEMRRDLQDQGLFASLSKAFDDAWERHQELDAQIHRYSIAELHQLLADCGLEVEHTQSAYVDAVVVIRARRT